TPTTEIYTLSLHDALPICLAELLDRFGLELLDEVHLIRPCSSHAARQRAVAFARPRDARSGPAALAVSLPPPFVSARRRSSHDPPIAALRGSCALPIQRSRYNEGIREGRSQSSPPHRSKARPLPREAAGCKRRGGSRRPVRPPTAHSRRRRRGSAAAPRT